MQSTTKSELTIDLAAVIASLDDDDRRQDAIDKWLDICMDRCRTLPRYGHEWLYWRTTMEVLELAFEGGNWLIVDNLISGLEWEAKR